MLEKSMAEHGEVQYTTADGNDLPAHEAGYTAFVHLAFVASLGVASLLFGLAIGGVIGHWLPSATVIILSVIVTAYGIVTGNRTPSVVMLAIAALALLYNAYS
jgi:Bacterial aa3 type cytochrome c oxidase subunit IV